MIRQALVTTALLATAVTATTAQQKEPPPAPGVPKDYRLPPRQTVELPNGVRLSMVRYGSVPKVTVQVSIETGTIDEGTDEIQLSAVTADLLLEGTATRSGSDISREAAEMGGSLSVQAGTDAVVLGGEVLGEFAERFIALAADVAQHPRFTDADVARIKSNRMRDNSIALSQPFEQARTLFRRKIFGNHPYGLMYASDSLIESYTTAKVKAFYAKNYGAKRVRIYVSGVFDPAVVERAVRGGFSQWTSGAPRSVRPPTLVARRSLEVHDRPGAVQTTLWVGLPVAEPTSADWIGLNVTDALLGGAFGSRITRNIREDKGYTYSPFSFLWARPKTAIWIEQADVTTNVTGPSLKEIFSEINKLRAEAPPAEELTGIKNNLAGIFVIQNNSRSGVIGQLQFVDSHGLGDAYLANYVKNVMAVTPEQVKQATVKFLDPSKMTIAAVGDRKLIDTQLQPYQPPVP